MKEILVIAPHPDDETLGCAGTLLRHKSEGDRIHWLIMTRMDSSIGFNQEQIANRAEQLRNVSDTYRFDSVNILDFITTRLDTMPIGDIVGGISDIVKRICPHTIYLPYRGDVHTDHKAVFDAATACMKWFRYPSVKRVLVYETLSETEFGINPDANGFRPNVFVDISSYMEKKLHLLTIYSTEIRPFPFPRSIEAIRALATLRGAMSGCAAAEAFMLLKEIL